MPEAQVKERQISRSAMDDLILSCKCGQKIETQFGSAPATMFCVERLTKPTIFVRFRVMAYGAEVAEVVYEQLNDGSVVREEI